MQTYASLFTGGGLADQGARMAGLRPVWGVEYDPAIAAVAQQNDPSGTVHAASVCDVDYSALPHADVLHASPPCPNFSVAKTGRGETEADRDLARAVARAIESQRPALFTLENVRAYQDSESLALITATLFALDYHVTTVILNAADHGVPQTRERLFLIAHAGGWMQASRALPAETPWQGWYAAIEDLIPTLPESAFAPWQLERLPAEFKDTALFDGLRHDFSDSRKHRLKDEPAATLTTMYRPSHMPRAFIADGQPTDHGNRVTVRNGDAPVMTVHAQMGARQQVRAFIVPDGNDSMATRGEREPVFTLTNSSTPGRAFLVGDQHRQIAYADEPALTVMADKPGVKAGRAWLSQGRVVSMTPRALGRFQTLPDTYTLPDSKSLACRIIGNGVACELYRRLLVSQLGFPSRRSLEAASARRAKASGAYDSQPPMLECLDLMIKRGEAK